MCLSVPLFSGVSISAREPEEDDKADLLGKRVVEEEEEEDIFSYKNKRLDEDDLFGGLDDPLAKKKPAAKVGEGLFIDDEVAADMLSHDFNDLLLLKAASHKDEGVFRARPKAVELAAADEDDVRVPDVDLESIEGLQKRTSAQTKPKRQAPAIGGGSGIKRGNSKLAAPTTLDDELFGLIGDTSTAGGSGNTTSAADPLDDISSYIARQQQTTSKGLFDD